MDQPFSTTNVALVGDILVSVTICLGTVDWHRHLDHDELFWVCEGAILLESEWERAHLQQGELAVVPKGVAHRSGSEQRASVLLLHCGVAPARKNGRRRLYAVAGEQLERANLESAVQAAALPFQNRTVAQVDGSVVQVAWGEGTWPVEIPAPHDTMVFDLRGTATLHTPEAMLHLHPGDFVVVPQGMVYQLSTTRDTALVWVTQGS